MRDMDTGFQPEKKPFGVWLQEEPKCYLKRLRQACGLFDGAMARSPEEALEQCITAAKEMRNALVHRAIHDARELP